MYRPPSRTWGSSRRRRCSERREAQDCGARRGSAADSQEARLAAQRSARRTREQKPEHAGALVIFGITGDLAKKMTFCALYRLERRGALRVPIVGVAVDDWTVEQLQERARQSIEGSGEDIDEQVLARLAERLSYVSG